MRLTIVYNNEANPGLMSGWGFSALIEECSRKILFDTGCEGNGLLYNLKKLGHDVNDIDILVLSHQQWDHMGGLFDVINLNDKIDVFALTSFSEHLKNEISKRANLELVESEQEISKNVYTTGLIKNNPDEQSLLLKTTKGIIVLAGCSHPGVDKILEIAKEYGKTYAIIGGFHGFSDLDILEGIEIIGASHCTRHINEIKERFPERFKEIKAGDVIEVK